MSGYQPRDVMEPTSCLIEDSNWNDGQFRRSAPYSHPVTHTRIHSALRPPCMQTLPQSKPFIVVSNSDSAGIQTRAAPYLPTCYIPQTRLLLFFPLKSFAIWNNRKRCWKCGTYIVDRDDFLWGRLSQRGMQWCLKFEFFFCYSKITLCLIVTLAPLLFTVLFPLFKFLEQDYFAMSCIK